MTTDSAPTGKPLTPERLAEIRARAEKAYPGPWVAEIVEDRRKSPEWDKQAIAEGFPELAAGPTFQALVEFGTADKRNVLSQVHYDLNYLDTLRFIAHAREDIPALLAELDRRVSPALSAEQEAELRAIRERAEAATPGPWRRDGTLVYVLQGSGVWMGKGSGYHEAQENRFGAAVSGKAPTDELEANANFIAHARSDVPRLLAIIAELTTHLRTQAE